jgi:hypothetical protein
MRPMTFDDIVSDYIRNYRDAARAEMETFRRERNRAAAIRRAALCELPDGKRHPHQCLIPKRLLELAEERLQAAAKRLVDARDFDALHEIVKREIGSVHGIGTLMVYDITHRIGAHFGKSPRLIYLHRGTKEGAAILGFRGETLDPALLPAEFSRLTAAEVEDCLCIYKDDLRSEPSRSRRNSGCGVARRPRRCWE